MANRTMLDYFICDTTLPKDDTITDLGVTYGRKLSHASYINTIVAKGSLRSKLIALFSISRLWFTDACIYYFCQTHLRILFSSWSPALKKDIVRIEAVQRRFTKRLSGLSKLP